MHAHSALWVLIYTACQLKLAGSRNNTTVLIACMPYCIAILATELSLSHVCRLFHSICRDASLLELGLLAEPTVLHDLRRRHQVRLGPNVWGRVWEAN